MSRLSPSGQSTPGATSLDNLKKEAKRWLKALRASDPEARARLARVHPNAPDVPGLRDIQHALALEHGAAGWTTLTAQLAAATKSPTQLTLAQYEEMADALLDAYRTGTPDAMERHYKHTWHRRAWQGMRTYVLADLGKAPLSDDENADISLDDARFLVAREHGFENWLALTTYIAALPAQPGLVAAKPVTLVSANAVSGGNPTVARERNWDTIVALMREKRINHLSAEGQMTDAVLGRLSRLDHVTSLDLSGSKELTDSGLRSLSRVPQLQHLDLSGTSITDQGIAVLGQLTELRTVNLAWTNVTDALAASLASCDHLERVDLTGTRTGNATIAALAGKRCLSHFSSGTGVTDAGLPRLREFPVFRSRPGADLPSALLDFAVVPSYLSLRGSFTDAGLESLVGMDCLFALNLDDGNLAVTAAGLAPLTRLSGLSWLACHATDEAMPYIAAMPKLRYLMCQDTPATDNGFVALSRSRSIEKIWGRRCYNLRSRGFAALSTMPSLRQLSVSCKNVDDSALSTIPQFPALRELMPMDIPDEGYRHIGRCAKLESLILMYCRDTTDRATDHITGLPNLKKYFASYTRITDRTPEMLSEIASLEEIELASCADLTNRGVAALARLPRLRTLKASGMPKVTEDAAAAFPATVKLTIDV